MENWKERLINEWNGRLVIKENRVIFKNISGENIVIPSSMYPLKEKVYTIFCKENTSDFVPGSELEQKVIVAFDRVASKVGECYANSELLTKELTKEGIQADTYVGWMFIDKEQLPIFHCFVVVEDKVLDYGAVYTKKELDFLYSANASSQEEARSLLVNHFKSKMNMLNHERFGFGQVDETYTYVACKCNPTEGKALHTQLLKMYPNHITHIKTQSSGKTKAQDMIKELGDY